MTGPRPRFGRSSTVHSTTCSPSLELQTCATLGMMTQAQAAALATAGLDYDNHNLDTSPEFYAEVITTRTYDDRLATLANVRAAGVNLCCGGIVGMGESRDDRAGLLHQLATMDPHPESVPINLLVQVPGTPWTVSSRWMDSSSSGRSPLRDC